MKYHASIRIFSEQLTIDKLVELIGINCDQKKEIGQPRGKGVKVVFKENIWILNSQVDSNKTLDLHIENLLLRIEAQQENIKKLKNQCDVICQCVVEGDENPILNFSQKCIKGLEQIGAELDIDLYIV